MKKILGIVLAFVMIISVFAVLPAFADSTDDGKWNVLLNEGIILNYYEGDNLVGSEQVAAKEMAKYITIGGKTTSVENYLKGLIAGNYGDYTKALSQALLNYGAAAYDYFSSRPVDPYVGTRPNGKPVTDTSALVAANPAAPVVNDDAGIYMGASLLLEGTLQLRFYFMGTDVTTNYGKATNPAGKVYSYVDVPVMPYDMEKAVTVTVGETSVTYAPINYLKNKAADPELSTMVASMYAYGVAAKAYADHEHIYEGEITLPATCTEMGETTYTCACGYAYIAKDVTALGHAYNAEGVVTQKAPCADRTEAFTCTRGCGHVKTEVAPGNGNHTSISKDEETAKLCRYITQDKTGKYVKADYCTECEEWATYEVYSSYNTDLSTAKSTNSGVTISGSTNISSYSSSGNIPTNAYPNGDHPRLLVNSDVLATIKQAIADGNEEMIDLLREVSFCANKYDASGKGGDLGSVTNHTSHPTGNHNYSEDLLNAIMSKAFMYLYTGTDYYAIEATRWMKQYLNTLKMEDGVSDRERYYGYAMFASAIVYDWCYNCEAVAADRDDLVKGIKNIASGSYGSLFNKEENMEIGFPPSQQSSVAGHGCEYQLLRDYLSVSLAIYDEYPDWYEYVGNRFFKEYVPVRMDYYEAGMVPQGVSIYAGIRFTSDLWSAWLMQSATGVNPYTKEDGTNNQQQVIRSIFSRVVDGAYFFFDEGDDKRGIGAWGLGELKRYVVAANISAYLYNDETAAAWAGSDWNENSSWYNNDNVWLFRLIFRSTQVENTGSRHEGLDLILYNDGFMNEIVAHTGWTSSDVSVLMKIGGYTVGNHDHGDAGSFQIYYKGMLAGDTGFYDEYGSSHHKNYHQATIAHNSIVVYNGSTAYGQKTGTSVDSGVNSGSGLYYSNWLNGKDDDYKTAELLGVSYKYDRSGNPKYAYIAGDITSAYSPSSSYVSGVQRRMLSVFNTNNSDVPAYFFVYDRVKTAKSSYQATFLLHTAAEPTISGNTVTVTSNSNKKTGGQLVLQSVLGAGEFVTYSGTQKYYVNGRNYSTGTAGDDGSDDCYWGRVEIKYPKGQTTDQTMLNVMYITDNGKTLSLPATGFSVGTVADGAAIGNTVAVFLKETSYNDTLTFTAPDTGAGTKVNYYVSGMAEGDWTITCGSQTIYVHLDADDGGLLVFNTYAGKEVTITKGHSSTGGSSSDNELPWDEAK